MINIETVKYSLKNLYERKTRSLFTILSIFVGIATIFIFISFGWGLYDYVGELSSGSSADKIIIQAAGGAAPGLDNTFKLTDNDVEAVEKTKGVFEASGVYFKAAEIKQDSVRKYTFLAAYDPKKPIILESYNIGLSKGRLLEKGDNGKILLGYNYQIPDKVFPKALDVGDKIEVQGKKLEVIGFFESIGNPQDDAQIYVINDFIDELFPEDSDSYAMIVGRVDLKDIDAVVDSVEKSLRKERNVEEGKEDFFVSSFQDQIEAFSAALNIVIGFIIMIALISVLVSAVNTANTMITSVLERVKEIGVIKSIGAKNAEIFKLFLFESGTLGFISGVVGVTVGWMITAAVGALLDGLGWGFLSPHYSWSLFAGCILFATLTGAISGVFPAYQASKLKPVEALRYE